MNPNLRSVLAAGVLFLVTVLLCLAWIYAFAWLLGVLGAWWRLERDDLDIMTLAGLLCIVLAVCGLVARRMPRL